MVATELANAGPDNPAPATLHALGRLCHASAGRCAFASPPRRLLGVEAGPRALTLSADYSSPPYVAVIFTNHKVVGDDTAYDITAARMLDLARSVDGFLGIESARMRTAPALRSRTGVTMTQSPPGAASRASRRSIGWAFGVVRLVRTSCRHR